VKLDVACAHTLKNSKKWTGVNLSMKDFKTVDLFEISRQHAKNMFRFQFQKAADPACA